jgi:hypothetical protein
MTYSYFLTVPCLILYYDPDVHPAQTLKTRQSESQTTGDDCEKRVYEISLTKPPRVL